MRVNLSGVFIYMYHNTCKVLNCMDAVIILQKNMHI